MTLTSVIVVLRHNTHLGGDLHLAQREFDALVGKPGRVLTTRAELSEQLSDSKAAMAVELASEGSLVASLYNDVSATAIYRLLSRSAFAQEVFVSDATEEECQRFCTACPVPCRQLADLAGGRLLVALAQGYVIESEAALDPSLMIGRIAATAALLLEPFVALKASSRSNRLRKAKKTTLSLSHDLHIYKAKFFPRMVRALLNIFGKDGATVFDPYCGSGTALLEAALLGLDSYGSDIDPICHLISRTKVAPFIGQASITESLKRFELRVRGGQMASVGFEFPDELRAKIERRDRIDETTYVDEVVGEATQLASALRGLRRDHPEEELLFTLASDAVTKKIRYRFVGVGNGRYTIEITRQPLLERLREKLVRSQQLADVFNEIETVLHSRVGKTHVAQGDARERKTWPITEGVDVILTSPPYLPASSGREHYASSRALAFSMLGYQAGQEGYFDTVLREGAAELDLRKFPEAFRLMTYLESDASADADPQRDAMRFERKAVPTRHYLADMRRFFESAQQSLAADGVLLLVVAHHHIFYSHRRGEIEHVVSGRDLYSELAADVGLYLAEEIEMELKKAVTSRARPMAKKDYYESVLVFRQRSALIIA